MNIHFAVHLLVKLFCFLEVGLVLYNDSSVKVRTTQIAVLTKLYEYLSCGILGRRSSHSEQTLSSS